MRRFFKKSAKQHFKTVIYDSDRATVSNSWDSLSVDYHYKFIESCIQKEFKGKTVLDIGPGFGHWIEFYKGCKVEAIELSKPMADTIRKKYGIKVYNCGVEDTITGEYDVINAIGVLHHIMNDQNLSKALSNIKQMMKRNSVCFIGTRLVDDSYHKERVRNFRTLDKWEELLKQSGLKIENIYNSTPPTGIKKHLDLIVCKK